MRSMSFILVTLYTALWIIGCAGMSPQLELEKSEIQYSKPLASTQLIKGEIIDLFNGLVVPGSELTGPKTTFDSRLAGDGPQELAHNLNYE